MGKYQIINITIAAEHRMILHFTGRKDLRITYFRNPFLNILPDVDLVLKY